MRGRSWVVTGVVAGVALALGSVPYLAGAPRSLADTLQRLVGAGGHLLTSASRRGAVRGRRPPGVLAPAATGARS